MVIVLTGDHGEELGDGIPLHSLSRVGGRLALPLECWLGQLGVHVAAVHERAGL